MASLLNIWMIKLVFKVIKIIGNLYFTQTRYSEISDNFLHYFNC